MEWTHHRRLSCITEDGDILSHLGPWSWTQKMTIGHLVVVITLSASLGGMRSLWLSLCVTCNHIYLLIYLQYKHHLNGLADNHSSCWHLIAENLICRRCFLVDKNTKLHTFNLYPRVHPLNIASSLLPSLHSRPLSLLCHSFHCPEVHVYPYITFSSKQGDKQVYLLKICLILQGHF